MKKPKNDSSGNKDSPRDRLFGKTKSCLPERAVQFGEGHFLQGCIDWMIDVMNKQQLFNGRIVAVQQAPDGTAASILNNHDGRCTLFIHGNADEKPMGNSEVISSISRGINPYKEWKKVLRLAESAEIEFVFSDTEETDFLYRKEPYYPFQSPLSYPGKLAAFLYRRFQYFNGDEKKGLTIIPGERVKNNGERLRKFVLQLAVDWKLPEEFSTWITYSNCFCNTFFYRAIRELPVEQKEEYGEEPRYRDALILAAESYYFLVIDPGEVPCKMLPFQEAGLRVKCGNVEMYRELGKNLLDAPSIILFAIGYLSDKQTVREVMEDRWLFQFIKTAVYKEIIPLLDFSEQEKMEVAEAGLNRLKNPFPNRELTDIGKNGLTKFKLQVLPLLLKSIQLTNQVPESLALSFAALLYYFQPVTIENGTAHGEWHSNVYLIEDQQVILELLDQAWINYDGSYEATEQFIQSVFSAKRIWGEDLTAYPALLQRVAYYLQRMLTEGVEEVLEKQMLDEQTN